MDEIERRQHRMYASLPAFARKVDWTYQIIEDALSKGVAFYLGFSGGSDSLVLLDLLYRAGHRIDIRWTDDGWDFPETLDFLKETETCYGFQIQRFRSLHNWCEWCEEMERPDLACDPEALEAWGNPREWDGGWATHQEWLKNLQESGYGGAFLGLLAKESRARCYVLHGGSRPLYPVKSENGMWHCSPLAFWSKQDIWAYVISRGLAYNPVYDTLAELDVPLERRRVAPLTCFRVMQYGSVVALKSGWPELFNKLAAIFPKVREYV